VVQAANSVTDGLLVADAGRDRNRIPASAGAEHPDGGEECHYYVMALLAASSGSELFPSRFGNSLSQSVLGPPPCSRI